MPVLPIRDDFPDWGVAPSLLFYNPTVYTVASPGLPIVQQDMNNYQYGVVTIGSGGVGGNDYAFNWLGAVGQESSIVSQTIFAVLDNGLVVIPFQAYTPTFEIVDVNAAAYPYDVGVAITLLSSPIYQHGFPGGQLAVNYFTTIAQTDQSIITPDGCGPGSHVFNVNTASTDWDFRVDVYPHYGLFVPYSVSTSLSGPLINRTLQLPATQWQLTISNNDVDSDFTVVVNRTPNPT